MYLEFYGLNKEPFPSAPEPEFFCLIAGHKQAMDTLVYGVRNRRGFIEITGEAGSGKTALIQAYLKQADPKEIHAVHIADARLTFEGLLQLLLKEWGLEVEENSSAWMLGHLYVALIEEHKAKRNIVLLFDNAHNMPMETLDRLRLLANLDASDEKVVQIVLAGEPPLIEKLAREELLALRQRITVRATLPPLTSAESYAYIEHRLRVAGCRDADLFPRSAMKRIVTAAKGVPQTINALCEGALAAGFQAQKRPVPAKAVDDVIAELTGQQKKGILRWLSGWPAVTLLIVVLTGIALGVHWKRLVRAETESPSSSAVKEAAAKPDGSQTDPAALGILEDHLARLRGRQASGNEAPVAQP